MTGACGLYNLGGSATKNNDDSHGIEGERRERQPLVEVGFDICGTDPEPEIPVDQGKPRMH
jgi:hypothetical protein